MSYRDPMTEERREARDETGWRTGASWERNAAFCEALNDYNDVDHSDLAERDFWCGRYDAIARDAAALAEAAPPSGLDVERLARAMTEASPRRVGIYAEAEAIAAEYARLPSEPTETGS